MSSNETATFGDNDVLIVVDVQNDFCPGGALAVPRGDEVVPIVNRMAARFRNVVLTQDWHPRGPFVVCLLASGQETVRDHCGRLRSASAVARPLRAGDGGRRVSLRPGSSPCRLDHAQGHGPRASIPIRRSTKTTATPRPAWSDICASAVLAAYFSPAWHWIFACATPPRTLGAKALPSSWSRTAAAASTSAVPSRRRGAASPRLAFPACKCGNSLPVEPPMRHCRANRRNLPATWLLPIHDDFEWLIPDKPAAPQRVCVQCTNFLDSCSKPAGNSQKGHFCLTPCAIMRLRPRRACPR